MPFIFVLNFDGANLLVSSIQVILKMKVLLSTEARKLVYFAEWSLILFSIFMMVSFLGGEVYLKRTNMLNSSNNDNDNDGVVGHTFQNLYPAIFQSFSIILFGYVSGRVKLLNATQSKGLGNYITYFALPALLLKSMVELNFGKVNWLFWTAILISKVIVFLIVFIFTLILGRKCDIGSAGIHSIACTQSNDFALGYPIIVTLYKDTHPEFIPYLYLFAPISLVLLNPIAFICLEIQKNRHASMSWGAMLFKVFKGIILNPVVLMVLIGLIGNYVFSQTVPTLIKSILETLSASFSATALFYLGLNMVGKIKQDTGFFFVTPVLLIAAKLVLLPLVARQVVYAMKPGGADSNLTTDFSTYGFLYGTIPAAPTAFIFASYYGIATAVIATAMVLGTFISAPLMFITASMVTLPVDYPDKYNMFLSDVSYDISWIGFGSCCWILLIFLLGRRYLRLPHKFTTNLVVAQMLMCIGYILLVSWKNCTYWQHLVQHTIFLVGVFSARCWAAMISVALCLLRCRSTCFVLQHKFWFYFYGWGVPMVVVGVLVAASNLNDDLISPVFGYGRSQLITSTLMLVLNILLTIIPLVILQRRDRFHHSTYEQLQGESHDRNPESDTLLNTTEDEDDISDDSDVEKPINSGSYQATPKKGVLDIEDIARDGIQNLSVQMCSASYQCSPQRKDHCRSMLLHRRRQERRLSMFSSMSESAKHQIGRHLVLLLLLILSMVVGLFLCTWKIFNNTESGIYIELEFLDSVFNYGQGFFVLAVFGFDTQYVLVPFIKTFRKYFYGVKQVHLEDPSDLSPEVLHTCDQFLVHHVAKCKNEIVQDLRYHFKTYSNVFKGSKLVDWLLDIGLAEERADGVDYGKRLLQGRVIQHILQEHNFEDCNYLYEFIPSSSSSSNSETPESDNTSTQNESD
ncbi:integral membrane protein GPR155-like isoform X2 [Anneissia japonica]|uniref:integral membrane protein GPR155-like isoform X2 n=1 Tax=Anneissia japonica TaxID=1529436 RepID=UPI00142571EF|nr:integral membrane protein GPR155-like isoform X2 [Anneissia japonica]